MPVQYRNRKNAVISAAQWQRLYRNVGYSQVGWDECGSVIIDTSWVGVHSPECEQKSRLFLTQVLPAAEEEEPASAAKVRRPKKLAKSIARDIWTETEEEAIEAHYRRVKEFSE